MVTMKRSPLMIVGLLCVFCITACGTDARATGAASSAAATSSVPTTVAVPTTIVVPTAQPTTNPIKVQVQNTVQSQVTSTAANTQSTTSTAASTTSSNQTTQATAQNNNNNNGNGSVTVVAAAQLSVNGQVMNVLTTGTGLTLYYRTSDPAPDSTCTGACAQTWPPFMAQGNVIPGSNIQGSLTVHTTANGSQVEYNGHPLYTYSGDAIHEVKGQGVNGVWNAVTVLAQKQKW